MRDWSLEIGTYPGILFGVRTYEQGAYEDYVLYLPFVCLILTFYSEDEIEYTEEDENI